MNSISLYIHIPFCYSKCDYCDFFSVPVGKKSIPQEYVDCLCREIRYKAKEYSVDYWSTVYIGGGTPSKLSEEQFVQIFNTVWDCGKINPEVNEMEKEFEFTIEMNPESVTPEKLKLFKNHHVNRISLGVQSLCDDALKNVKRSADKAAAFKAMEIIKTKWNGKFSFDFIAGLPCQSEEQFIAGLKDSLKFNPDHISLYTLTIEEGTPLQKRIDAGEEYDFDESDRIYLLGRDFLLENGFLQYEVSNFCRPGCFSRHNLNYWKQGSYIGCGAGACSTLYEEGYRFSNTQDINQYLNDFLSGTKEELDLKTLEYEFFMMGFRSSFGITESDYKKKFSKVSPWFGNLQERLGVNKGIWAEYEKNGYTSVYKNRQGEKVYSLNSKGMMFLTPLLLELME